MFIMAKSIIGLILSLFMSVSIACTNITLKAQDNAIVTGRTLEFGPLLKSQLMTSNQGREFTNKGPKGKPGLSWRATYGYVYLNGFNQQFALDGMNEKGLSVSVLYLPNYTDYPLFNEEKQATSLPYFLLGDWVLSQFKTTAEVKKALQSIDVFAQPLKIAGYGQVIFPLHTIVTDSTGSSVVIEFNNKAMQVYDNPMGVMTNSPTFDWHLTNLKNYINLTPYASKAITVDGFDYIATGQGSGMLGLPGDTTPPSRFVRMAFLTQTALTVPSATQAVVLTSHILGNVFIPKGFVRGAKGSDEVETTQWTVIKDLKNKIVYFKSYQYPTLQSIQLSQLDFSAKSPLLKLDVDNPSMLSVDATEAFKKKASQ